MNIKKQQTKGNKMKKIVMMIGLISVLATSANAGYWTHTPNVYGGGYTSTYTPTYNSLMGGWH